LAWLKSTSFDCIIGLWYLEYIPFLSLHLTAEYEAVAPPAMAAMAVDISSLSSDQQAALEQYMAVTNQDVEAAVGLLQRTQWNVTVSEDVL
jgi:hypothetical protein